jgi:hypothetical protein
VAQKSAADSSDTHYVVELADGSPATIIHAHDTGSLQPVFNFEVDGFHTYYVGKHGIWVHNTNYTRFSHIEEFT